MLFSNIFFFINYNTSEVMLILIIACYYGQAVPKMAISMQQ